jgi:hypothetical protein
MQSANFRAVSRDALSALFREETDGEEMAPLPGESECNICAFMHYLVDWSLCC